MKKTILAFGIILLLFQSELTAQTLKSNYLGLQWGIGNLQRQDKSFSPFIHGGTSLLNIGVSYEHTGKQYHRVYTRFGHYTSQVGESYTYLADWSGDWEIEETYPHTFNIIDINYALGFSVLDKSNISLMLGGQLRNLFNQGQYIYGSSGIGYYNFSFALDFWARVNYKLHEKHSIGTELSLPVVAWAGRSPYLGQDDEYFYNVRSNSVFKTLGNYIADGELLTSVDNFRIDLQLNYTYQISPKWGLTANYLLDINTSEVTDTYRSVENVLLIGAKLKL